VYKNENMALSVPRADSECNEDEDVAWDNLCINPHSKTQEDGRERGRYDGSISGYNEGYKIGRTTAVSNGMEIGFIQGVIAYLTTKCDLPSILVDNEKVERAQKSIQNLQMAINEFPSADALLQRTSQTADINDDDDDDDDMNSNIDISNNLQRIRARFKLLMVQLGLSHVSLNHLLDTAAATSEMVYPNPENVTSTVTHADSHNTSEW
jgi:hypothetical protein